MNKFKKIIEMKKISVVVALDEMKILEMEIYSIYYYG